MIKPSLALLAVVLLAGCGGHQLAACSGSTFALAGPTGDAEAVAPVSAFRPALPARKPVSEPADPFAPRGGSMVFQKADAR
jgi:hypothetical protein